MIGSCLVCHVELTTSDEMAAHQACRFSFTCPNCNRSFREAKDLGSHRLGAHGVKGTSAKARALAKAKAGHNKENR